MEKSAGFCKYTKNGLGNQSWLYGRLHSVPLPSPVNINMSVSHMDYEVVIRTHYGMKLETIQREQEQEIKESAVYL